MSDVDAVRLLASEYNLEFVDLDNYNVDLSAAAVLPASVARTHNVVPIGRKFGAPVIAISDPGDVMAMDTLRATIGREFISVVAVGEQIAATLARVYGVEEPASDMGAGVAEEPVAAATAPPAPAAEEDPLSAALDDALGLSVYGMAFAPAGAEVPTDDLAPTAPEPTYEPEVEVAASADEGDYVGGTGLETGYEPDVAAAVEPELGEVGGPEFDVHPVDLGASADDLGLTTQGVEPDYGQLPEDAAYPAAEEEVATLVPEGVGDQVLAAALEGVASAEDALASAKGAVESLLGELDLDQLAAAANQGVDLPEVQVQQDSVALAAEIVDEAVAEFEREVGDAATLAATSADTAHFPPLARVLVEGGRVSLQDMNDVLEEHAHTGQTIARLLTSKGLVTEADLMWGMAQEMGLEFVDLDSYSVSFEAAFILPEATARHHNVLVIGRTDENVPIVAASNPTDVFAMDDLRTILGRNFVIVVSTRSQINAWIDRAYSPGGDAAEMATVAAGDFEDSGALELDTLQVVADDAPIVRYVNLLILQALNERASDVHVEPTQENLRVRYRIDGVLHDMQTAPRAIAPAVTTRLKVMAELNIAEHRVPQDGRISLNVGNRSVDLRIATLPTIYGEKIVMRILDKSNVVLTFEELGFDADLLERYETVYTRPYGTILVTGPTGSGKTTTLYATLSVLNTPEKNIITVEDPVELRIKGINQVQLNVRAGLTFASALKSILRSDPDIVLVGEIRDTETANISIEAALTGHLVLATLHTNDAASTPMRMVEMGVAPYLVTSAVTGALAQRLARRLCQHCREPFEPTEADIVAAGWAPEDVFSKGDNVKLYRAVGCSACSNTGYRGRKALLEFLLVTEEIERLIIEGGSADDIHKLAVEQGMVTLRESGLRKALEGETTLEEVLRVVA